MYYACGFVIKAMIICSSQMGVLDFGPALAYEQFHPFQFLEESVSKKISFLNSNKVAGLDWIVRKLLRLAEPAIVSPLTKLYSMNCDKGDVFSQ